ncbi:phage tail protein [Amycolatopsis plumensis]|uniref:Phage-related protein n=1 Tax=Amycolatopsis plumensis TaxID=236508 RepID=A0ABV5U8M7_9PSEU
MALNIGELVGYLKLDRKQWNAGLVAARAQLKRLGAGNKDLNEIEHAVGRAAKGFVTLATKIAAVGAGANVLVSVVGLLASMSGALGLAVAAGLAAAGVMAAVKLGADGAKRAFEALDPTLDRLKANVSKSFESALIPAVNNLKGLLPKLQGGLQQIATAVGGVATKVTAMLNSGAQSAQLQSILAFTARLVDNIGKAAAPVIAAFIRIGAVAMPILLQLTNGAGAAAERFNAWVQRMADTGNITQWIQTAIDAFRSLGTILDNVIGIFADVFGALQDAGVGLGGTIGVAVAAIRDFLETAQGHDVLVALANAIAQVSALVGQVLTAALQAVAPLLPPLLGAFVQLATQAVPLLVGAITFLAPVLLNIATFIQQNIDWIGPLAIALGVWTAAQWALNIALDANPIGLIILAIGALIAIVATIITYWEPIAGFFVDLWNTVWKWTSDRISDIRDFIVNVWNGIVDWFAGLGSKIGSAFSSVIDWFASLPGKIGGFLASLPGTLWNAFTAAFQFALNAVVQGIEWVIAEVIALPLQIIWVVSQLGQLLWDLLVAAWNFAVEAVKAGVNAVVDFVVQLPGRVVDGLIVIGSLLVGLFTGAWNWALNTTVDLIFNIINFVRTLPQRIIDGISALGSMLSNAAGAAWRWFISTMISTAEGVWGFVRSIPGRILDGLGNLGSLLWDAGAAIIRGLLNGLKSAVGAVWDFVGGIADKIRSLKGPLPYDRQLLVPAGLAIMSGLHAGLKDGFKPIETWVSGVADTIAGTITTNTSGMAAAAREILDRINNGGDVFEDFSYRGSSANVDRYNDDLAQAFYRGGGQLDATQMTAFLQKVIDQQQRATVQIENYHPPADASPHEVAEDLDWLSRTGG